MKLNRIKVYDADDSVMLEIDNINDDISDDEMFENFDGEIKTNEN